MSNYYLDARESAQVLFTSDGAYRCKHCRQKLELVLVEDRYRFFDRTDLGLSRYHINLGTPHECLGMAVGKVIGAAP